MGGDESSAHAGADERALRACDLGANQRPRPGPDTVFGSVLLPMGAGQNAAFAIGSRMGSS